MIESNTGWEVERELSRLKHLLGNFLDAWNAHKEPSAHDIDEAWSICYGDRPKSTLDEPTTQD